jgi:serine/threonine-protein kinase
VGAAADHRSDIYSWGIVAYEVLAGAHPFEHRQGAQQLVAAHLTEAPRPLTERRPELPLEVCAVVERAMRKDPADRPGSARELLEALDAFATPGALRQVAPRRTRTRRRFVYVISAVIGVLALVGSAWVVDRARGARASADTPPRIAVLAFENLGAPGDKYFADGVTDEIRAKLAEVPGLRVMGRISSRSYEKTTKTPKQIGKELDHRATACTPHWNS